VSQQYQRQGDEGGTISFHFCGQCGSTVYYFIESMPELIAIALGAFASHELPGPSYSVYETRQHPWVALEGEMDHYD